MSERDVLLEALNGSDRDEMRAAIKLILALMATCFVLAVTLLAQAGGGL